MKKAIQKIKDFVKPVSDEDTTKTTRRARGSRRRNFGGCQRLSGKFEIKLDKQQLTRYIISIIKSQNHGGHYE